MALLPGKPLFTSPEASAGFFHVQSRLAIDTDDDDGAHGGGPGSPSWDRALHNHSPLAALMRREFPGGPAANRPRHLFDDL